MFPCEVGERTMGEGNHGTGVVSGGVIARVVGDHRVETEPVEVVNEGFESGWSIGVQRSPARTFVLADRFGVVGARVETLRHRQHHSGQYGHGRRLEAQCRGISSERIPVLRPAHVPAATDLDIDKTDVTHPIQVGAYRVRVQR